MKLNIVQSKYKVSDNAKVYQKNVNPQRFSNSPLVFPTLSISFQLRLIFPTGPKSFQLTTKLITQLHMVLSNKKSFQLKTLQRDLSNLTFFQQYFPTSRMHYNHLIDESFVSCSSTKMHLSLKTVNFCL